MFNNRLNKSLHIHFWANYTAMGRRKFKTRRAEFLGSGTGWKTNYVMRYDGFFTLAFTALGTRVRLLSCTHLDNIIYESLIAETP